MDNSVLPRQNLNSDDFGDVFGGPPLTVLLRRFPGELSPFTKAPSIYSDIFRPTRGMGKGSGRRMPEFRVPARVKEGFYDDIFGLECVRRPRSRSTSGLSSEDDDSSSFVSKLRPITVPSRRHYSPPLTISGDDRNSSSTLSNNPYPVNYYFLDAKDAKTNRSSDLHRQRSHMGFSCCFSPPETISLEASFRGNYMETLHFDNSDADSPSSVTSSIFLDPETEKELVKAVMEIVVMAESPARSYAIRFNSNDMVNEGAAAVDEAIAWAKQKFWSHQTSKEVEIKDDEQVYSSDCKSMM